MLVGNNGLINVSKYILHSPIYQTNTSLTFKPLLDRYISECMISIININSGIQKPTSGYQNCNTNRVLIFDGYLKVRESLNIRVIIWVNTILNHIDTRVILPRYESSCMVYKSKWYWKQNCRQIPIPIPIPVNECKIFISDTQVL